MTDPRVCVDASVTIKLALQERGSTEARRLWQSWMNDETTIGAPRLWVWECANALWSAVRAERLTQQEATVGLEGIMNLPVTLLDIEDDVGEVWAEFIQPLQMPSAYDATYLYAAAQTDALLYTADARLYNTVSDKLPWVRLLRAAQ